MGKVAGNVIEEGGRWMPEFPRASFGRNDPLAKMEILPLVDDEWRAVQDKWVLPGRRVLTTEELSALADARGVTLTILKE